MRKLPTYKEKGWKEGHCTNEGKGEQNCLGRKVQDLLMEQCGLSKASHSYRKILRNKDEQPDWDHNNKGLKVCLSIWFLTK